MTLERRGRRRKEFAMIPDDMLRILLPQAEARRLAKPLKDMQGACYREADTTALLKAGLWSRIDAERARAAP
jgi:hypothetical protein